MLESQKGEKTGFAGLREDRRESVFLVIMQEGCELERDTGEA
jgi:hypothetical protein